MSAPPLLRIRALMGWGVVGQASYLVTQLLVLVALTRLTTIETVGLFGLVTSILVPIFFLFGMNMRVNYASGATAGFRFEDYIALLALSAGCGIAVAFGLGAMLTDGLGWRLLVIIALTKATETFSDLAYGAFLRYERVSLVAVSMLMRGGIGVVLFWLLLLAGAPLEVVFLSQLAVWLVMAAGFDLPRAWRMSRAAGDCGGADLGRIRRLARSGITLGGTNGVIALQGNIPRYVIASMLGITALGYFSVVGYAMQAVVSIFAVVMNSLIARVSAYMRDGDTGAVSSLLVKLLAGVGLFGIAAVGGSLLVGDWLVEAVFGPDFVGLGGLLAICMGAAALRGAASVVENLLMAGRRFGTVLALRSGVALGLIGLCIAGGALLGLPGVALGICAAFGLHFVVLSVLVLPPLLRGSVPDGS